MVAPKSPYPVCVSIIAMADRTWTDTAPPKPEEFEMDCETYRRYTNVAE
jgi:hypothetical protein